MFLHLVTQTSLEICELRILLLLAAHQFIDEPPRRLLERLGRGDVVRQFRIVFRQRLGIPNFLLKLRQRLIQRARACWAC